MFNNISKTLIVFCAVVSTMFLLNSNELFSASSTWAKCSKPGGRESCGTCPDGTRPNGTGSITCGTNDAAIDYGSQRGLTSRSIATEQVTSVFFPDDDTSGVICTTGIGYIDATVRYGHQYIGYIDSMLHTVDSYVLCDAIEIKDYHLWYETCELMYYNISSASDKALVSPNPTSGDVTINLKADYINACNVQSVNYSLFNSSNVLVATFPAYTPSSIVTIPAEYLIPSGMYYIGCDVIKQYTGTDLFTLPLVSE